MTLHPLTSKGGAFVLKLGSVPMLKQPRLFISRLFSFYYRNFIHFCSHFLCVNFAYDYIEFPNSGHGMLGDPDKSVEFYQLVDEYIERYFVNK